MLPVVLAHWDNFETVDHVDSQHTNLSRRTVGMSHEPKVKATRKRCDGSEGKSPRRHFAIDRDWSAGWHFHIRSNLCTQSRRHQRTSRRLFNSQK